MIHLVLFDYINGENERTTTMLQHMEERHEQLYGWPAVGTQIFDGVVGLYVNIVRIRNISMK